MSHHVSNGLKRKCEWTGWVCDRGQKILIKSPRVDSQDIDTLASHTRGGFESAMINGVYADEIFQYLKKRARSVDPTVYWRGLYGVTSSMHHIHRTEHITLVYDYCRAEKYRQATVFLAIQLYDRYVQSPMASHDEPTHVSCACLTLASKYEEVKGCKPGELVEFVATHLSKSITSRQVCDSEIRILTGLNFSLSYPTPAIFLGPLFWQLRSLLPQDTTGNQRFEGSCNLARYGCELTVLPLKNEFKYTSDLRAAAAAFLAVEVWFVSALNWDAAMYACSGFRRVELVHLAKVIADQMIMQTVRKSVIYDKYATSSYDYTAQLYHTHSAVARVAYLYPCVERCVDCSYACSP